MLRSSLVTVTPWGRILSHKPVLDWRSGIRAEADALTTTSPRPSAGPARRCGRTMRPGNWFPVIAPAIRARLYILQKLFDKLFRPHPTRRLPVERQNE